MENSKLNKMPQSQPASNGKWEELEKWEELSDQELEIVNGGKAKVTGSGTSNDGKVQYDFKLTGKDATAFLDKKIE